MFDETSQKVTGHVLIKDADTQEVLLDKHNHIHFENFSIATARGLAGRNEGNIFEMHFGNGGSAISGTGGIVYFPTNTSGFAADLYNPTYFKVINDQSPLNTDPANNYIEVRHLQGTVYSDIIIVCTLDYAEPSGQEAFDDASELNSDFVFDELGLKTYSTEGPGKGSLISHVVMSPIGKSLNRKIQITYTIRIILQ